MRQKLDRITEAIIGGAIEMHKAIGPGALESAYETCLAFELNSRRLAFERQKRIPVLCKGRFLDCGYRADFAVERLVIVELKSVQRIEPVHEAPLNSSLKFSGCHVRLRIHFNVPMLSWALRRRVLDYRDRTLRPLR